MPSHGKYQLTLVQTIDFAGQVVGTTSAPQTLTLQNTGTETEPVVIESITTSSGNYVSSTTCASLASGQSCTISVQFTPQSAGALSDQLTISTRPAGLLPPVPLMGTGLNPKSQSQDTKTEKDAKDFPDTKGIKDKPLAFKEGIAPAPPDPGEAAQALPVEDAAGEAFIHPEERPQVGQQALAEPNESTG